MIRDLGKQTVGARGPHSEMGGEKKTYIILFKKIVKLVYLGEDNWTIDWSNWEFWNQT